MASNTRLGELMQVLGSFCDQADIDSSQTSHFVIEFIYKSGGHEEITYIIDPETDAFNYSYDTGLVAQRILSRGSLDLSGVRIMVTYSDEDTTNPKLRVNKPYVLDISLSAAIDNAIQDMGTLQLDNSIREDAKDRKAQLMDALKIGPIHEMVNKMLNIIKSQSSPNHQAAGGNGGRKQKNQINMPPPPTSVHVLGRKRMLKQNKKGAWCVVFQGTTVTLKEAMILERHTTLLAMCKQQQNGK